MMVFWQLLGLHYRLILPQHALFLGPIHHPFLHLSLSWIPSFFTADLVMKEFNRILKTSSIYDICIKYILICIRKLLIFVRLSLFPDQNKMFFGTVTKLIFF